MTVQGACRDLVLLTNLNTRPQVGNSGREVKRPRQGWRGTSRQGHIHGVLTICRFSPQRALCH
ncbi:hypothetical protein CS534_01785 [Yersinia ruckeri]|nr:hypothetical protein CS534_01785 [Yersinia ruckeri]